jgi:hypothetical protein
VAITSSCFIPNVNVIQLFENSLGISGVIASFNFTGKSHSHVSSPGPVLTAAAIGGGTAGNTIAARLIQNFGVSVALIEAGRFYLIDNGVGTVIPSLATTQFIEADLNNTRPLVN